MTNECLEPIYGEDGEECYLLPVFPRITLNSSSAQSRLRCSAFVIGHDCLLSNMERWLHSAIWRNSSWEMYLSKLARSGLINLYSRTRRSHRHRPTPTVVGWCQGWQSTHCNAGECFPECWRYENPRLSQASILPGRDNEGPSLALILTPSVSEPHLSWIIMQSNTGALGLCQIDIWLLSVLLTLDCWVDADWQWPAVPAVSLLSSSVIFGHNLVALGPAWAGQCHKHIYIPWENFSVNQRTVQPVSACLAGVELKYN